MMRNKETASTAGTARKPEILTSVVRIVEQREGWRLWWSSEDYEDHGAAAEALQAVCDRGDVLAEAGISTAIVVEWEAGTRIGRMVAEAMAS